MKLRVISALLISIFAAIFCPPFSQAAQIKSIRLEEDLRRGDSRILTSSLEDEDSAVRARAARAMGRVQSNIYGPDLITAAMEKAPEVRLEAVFAMGQLRMESSSPALQGFNVALKWAARDSDPTVRLAAIEALGKSGGEGIEQLIIDHMSDPSAAVRAEAVTALFRLRFLSRIPEYSTNGVLGLFRALEDDAPEVRRTAAFSLSRWAEPRAAEKLLKASENEDEFTKMFALRAWAKLGLDAPEDLAQTWLEDPSYHVRVEAVRAVAESQPDLLDSETLIQDRSHHVRAALAESASSTQTLSRLLTDKSFMASAAALRRLAELSGEAASETVWGKSQASDWRLRAAAAQAAGFLPETGLPLASALLSDADLRVKMAALETMVKFSTPGSSAPVSAAAVSSSASALGVLKNVLLDMNAAMELRGIAVEAAGKHPGLLPALTQAYTNSLGREFVEVRETASDAAKALKDSGGDGLLRLMLADPAPSVRIKAAAALGEPAPAAPEPDPSPYLSASPPSERAVGFETRKGRIVIELFGDDAPLHAANIVAMAKKGVYDGKPWHRVVSNFVVQGGDPRGTGWGDAGLTLRDEVNRRRYDRGAVGMPKAGRDTGGCQLFVSLVPTPHLDGRYTVFGRVISDMAVVDSLEPGDVIERAWAK